MSPSRQNEASASGPLDFFDANMLYGVPSKKTTYPPVVDCQTLSRKTREFGIARAVVRCEEQFFGDVAKANEMVAKDVKRTDNLWAVWTLLPTHCHELPEPNQLLANMRDNRIAGWQFFPEEHRYPFHWRVLKDWLELAESKRVPLFIDLKHVPQRDLLDVLEKFPQLTIILRNPSVLPPDRILRPFLFEFQNVHMELSKYLISGGVEALVADGFAERILFASGFHAMHVGGPMMMVKHAEISPEAKTMIASKNLERILSVWSQPF